MPAGPLGWIHQMHWEPGCEFESVAQELAPVELGSGLWIGPTLPRHVGDVAPFRPHLSLLLLPGGEFGVWGVGGGRGVLALGWGGGVGGGGGGGGAGGACLWVGEGRGMLEGRVLGRGSCTKVSSDGPMISSVDGRMCQAVLLSLTPPYPKTW